MSTIKNKFRKGAIPTEQDFSDLIDFTTQVENFSGNTLDLTKNTDTTNTNIKAHFLEGDGTNITNVSVGSIENSALPEQVDLTQNGETSQIKAKTVEGETATFTSVQGDGSLLTNLNPGHLSVGKIDNAHLPESIDLTQAGSINKTSISAGSFSGDGSSLTNLNPDNLAAGKIDNAHLPEQIDLTDAGNVDNSSITAGSFIGNGASLTDLDPSKLGEGIISNDRLNSANKIQHGIVRYANKTEVENGEDHLAVTAKAMHDNLQKTVNDSKSYVDGEIAKLEAGLKFKKGVVAVKEQNFALDGSEKLPNIEGYQVAPGDRVLFVNQDTKPDNKVWVANADKTWTIAEDFNGDTENEIFVGMSVEVLEGAGNKNSIWTLIEMDASEPPVLTWKKRSDINKYQAGDGIEIDGQTIKAQSSWVNEQVEDQIGDQIGKALIDISQLKSDTQGAFLAQELLPVASVNTQGILAIASNDEVKAGTVSDKVVTPGQIAQAQIDIGQLTNTVPGARLTKDWLPVAAEESEGIISLATDAEITSGTVTNKAVSPKQLSDQLALINNDTGEPDVFIQNLESSANGLLKVPGSETYEAPAQEKEYLSPIQHGGLFGTIYRQYIKGDVSTDKVLANIPNSELIDAKILLGHNGYQTLSGINNNQAAEPAVRLYNSGELKLEFGTTNSGTVNLRGGWFDYNKVQVNAFVKWNAGNAISKTFPEAGEFLTDDISNSLFTISGITADDDNRHFYYVQNNSTSLDISTAPFLSYRFDTLKPIQLDRFVIHGNTQRTFTLELRSDLDGFQSTLGTFASASEYYQFSSVNLKGMQIQTGQSIEFRVFVYGTTSRSLLSLGGGTYFEAADGTPEIYNGIYASASVWKKSAS